MLPTLLNQNKRPEDEGEIPNHVSSHRFFPAGRCVQGRQQELSLKRLSCFCHTWLNAALHVGKPYFSRRVVLLGSYDCDA